MYWVLILCVLHIASGGVSDIPPRGWNSWDSFKGTLNESEFKTTLDLMASMLLPAGYDTATIDEFWYANDGESAAGLDKHGRAVPDPSKWPSAARGVGFKAIAQHVHQMGMKIGIHVMHGIPEAALKDASLTVLGRPNISVASLSAGYSCPWNDGWYKIDMSKEGAQDYVDSIYALYASWDVDFIKNDCVFGENFDLVTLSNIQAARLAMDRAGRDMVYSLSPGFQADGKDVPGAVGAVAGVVHMYRMTSDWHGWRGADGKQGWPNHFELASAYSSYIAHPSANGRSWPDLDMLDPTMDIESTRMQQTLWSMARSPLIFGGDLRNYTKDHWMIQLLTHAGVLEVSSNTTGNRQVRRSGTDAVWSANGAAGVYVALFRLAGSGSVSVPLADVGLHGMVKVHDVWKDAPLPDASSTVSVALAECTAHGGGPCAALLLLSKA